MKIIFFIYIDKSDLTYHIKAGEKAEGIDQFLKKKGLNKKQQKDSWPLYNRAG